MKHCCLCVLTLFLVLFEAKFYTLMLTTCICQTNAGMGQLRISGGILMSTKIERDVTSGLLWTPVFVWTMYGSGDLNSAPAP